MLLGIGEILEEWTHKKSVGDLARSMSLNISKVWLVSDGQEVKKGDLLISFDMDKIKAAGYKVTTPLIIGNTDDYASVEPVAQNSVSAGDMILKIK